MDIEVSPQFGITVLYYSTTPEHTYLLRCKLVSSRIQYRPARLVSHLARRNHSPPPNVRDNFPPSGYAVPVTCVSLPDRCVEEYMLPRVLVANSEGVSGAHHQTSLVRSRTTYQVTSPDSHNSQHQQSALTV